MGVCVTSEIVGIAPGRENIGGNGPNVGIEPIGEAIVGKVTGVMGASIGGVLKIVEFGVGAKNSGVEKLSLEVVFSKIVSSGVENGVSIGIDIGPPGFNNVESVTGGNAVGSLVVTSKIVGGSIEVGATIPGAQHLKCERVFKKMNTHISPSGPRKKFF